MRFGISRGISYRRGGLGVGGGGTAPATITVGQWTLGDNPSAGGDTLTINIIALPFDGNSTITALEYRLNGGAAIALVGTGTGARDITVPAVTEADVEIRAVNAIGNGEWSDIKTATPTVLSDGSTPFGALTKSDAGGVATTGSSITSGNASGHWQIVGGFVVPTTTGDTDDLNAGPYNLVFNDASTMDISIVANSYSIRTVAELETAGEDASLALGDQILFRSGTYYAAPPSNRIRRTTAPSGTWNGSNYIVFKPHTGATVDLSSITVSGEFVSNCYMEFTGFRMVATNASNTIGCISLIANASYVYVHDCTSNTPDPGETAVDTLSPYFHSAINTAAGNLRIENNVFSICKSGIIVSGDDCVIKNNDIRTAYVDHVKLVPPIRRLQVIGNVLTDKKSGYTPYTITAITRGNPTLVTVTDATGVVATDDVIFNGLTGCEGLIGGKYNISNVAGNVLTVDVNSTGFTDWVSGGEARISDIHGDFLQTTGAGATDGQLDDVVIRGNRISRGAGSPADIDGQGIFLQDNTTGVYYRNLLIEGNIIDCTLTNAISIQNPLNSIVRNNVVVRKLGHPGAPGTTQISFAGSGTGNSCIDNVSNAFTYSATVETQLNNHTLAQNDSAAYAAAFDDPLTGEESSDVAVAYAPKVGGVLEVATPTIGAVPHQSFVSPWTFTNPRTGPTNTVTPVLSGTETEGETLTSTQGTWTGDPTITYAYQWQTSPDGTGSWTDIGGATSTTYLLTAGEVGEYIRCRVRGTNGGGSTDAFTNVTGAIAAAAALFHTQSGTGPYFKDPSSPGADVERLEWKVRFYAPANPGAFVRMFSQESLGCDLEISSSGIPRANVETGAGTNVVLVQSASTAITLNTWQELEFDVDQVAGTANVILNGSNILSRTWTPNTSTDYFQTTRPLSFFANPAGANPLPSGWQIEYAEVYKTVLGVRTLHKRIEGNAATVNADGWKLGTDAT